LIWCTPFGKAWGRAHALAVSRSFAEPFTSVAIVGTTQQEAYSTGTECVPPTSGWPLCNASNPFTADFGDTETTPNGFIVRFDADTKEMTWSTALTHMEPTDVTSYERTVYVGANPLETVSSTFLADEQDYFTALEPDDPGSQLVMGFDETGLFYGSKYGGIGLDQLVAVAMNPEGRYYVAGQADVPALFPLNCPPQTGNDAPWCVFAQSGGGDIFYGQLKIITPQVVGSAELPHHVGSVIAVPNPADDVITFITGELLGQAAQVEILDALGRTLLTERVRPISGRVEMQLRQLAPGAYRARFRDATFSVVATASFILTR
jgi:hypothetical protein